MHRHGLIAIVGLLCSMLAYAQDETAVPDDERVSFHAMMGTAENPTIEGGWINQVEAKPAHQTRKLSERQTNTTAITDELSSDTSIKKLLRAAAEQHKLAYVLHRAEQLKLPATVALIPMVESRYQTHALSSHGARGAWQLMPQTANDYGLNPERSFEFNASTDAALQLLKNLHQRFHSWTLAFAAYHAGSQRVLSALQQNPQARGMEALPLPEETQQYVRRLKQLAQAMARVSAQYFNVSGMSGGV